MIERVDEEVLMPATLAPLGARSDGAIGPLLREWRAARGMSQLELALRAGFSSRHVSFIETGRTQPSRQALLDLAEALDVPLRERNRLLEAGGYAHVYRHTPLAAAGMAHVRGVLQFIPDRHAPYAALVLDRHANCLMGNVASGRLLALLVDPSLMTPHANQLRLVFHPLGARRWIVNWDQVARHLLARAERDASDARDAEATALLADLRRYGHRPPHRVRDQALHPADLLLPVHVKKADLEMRLFSTIMTLGTPQDVTLQELRIETLFPADAESEACWARTIASQ